MKTLTELILKYAQGLPEGTPIAAKALLHLGKRAALDQALARLVRRGKLLRASRGLYVLPVESRYGKRAPSAEKVVEALATQKGEFVALSGAAAANTLGLTTQVPVRTVYLTSGHNRTLKLGALKVEMRHVPRWQLTLANRPAGEAVRALAWAGPNNADKTLLTIKTKLSKADLTELFAARASLPTWIAQPISQLVANG
jgi:hypothetical protein